MRFRIIVLVVLALSLAACSAGQTVPPTTQTGLGVFLSATPAGWVPVAFGDAQVAVPASWYVLYNEACPTWSVPGEVFLKPRPVAFDCAQDTVGPRTAVSFTPAASTPHNELPAAAYRRPVVINGISVFAYRAGPPGSYLVPSLGIEITVNGVLAQRVLHTLTHSPRAVVLAPGSAPPVPSYWRSVIFAGVRFSAPADLPVARTQDTTGLGDICGTAGVALFGSMVTLSTDQRPFVVPLCPLMLPRPQTPLDGVQVDSGLLTEPGLSLSFGAHCLDLRGLRACPATSPDYSILVLRVTVPGRANPVFVSIGLAGNGMIARTILYSLRAA